MDVQRANACLHMFTGVVTIGEPGLFVRFTPKSGHVRRTSSCLLWARSGLMHRSKKELLFDYFVCTREQRWRHRKTERLCCLQINR
jgi:hypothetical protein